MGKLHVTERRVQILEYIVFHKQTTRKELAEHFGVCINTIVNDIDVISISAPIYTKQGNGGGIYILPEYRSYKNYLTDTEEELLYKLMQYIENEEKRILCGIITKFTKNPVKEQQESFQL